MQSQPSQSTPTGWTGAPALMQQWLARRCTAEGFVNLVGGAVFLVLGLVVLGFTSFINVGIVYLILLGAKLFLGALGISLSLFRPGVFAALFLFFVALTIRHAYKTRWKTESAAQVDFGTAFYTFTSMSWEFLSAGPILLVLSVQDFSRFVRLSRLDIPHVSTLLLWLYDKGGRATFSEICLAFPALNAVRVLPQLRDLSGVMWWPEDGEISLSDSLRRTFAQLLGREPKNAKPFGHDARDRHYSNRPTEPVDAEIFAWYAALNLPLFTPLNKVKTQYRKLAKLYHPDTRARDRANGEIPDDEQMKRINEAYHNIIKSSQKQAGVAR